VSKAALTAFCKGVKVPMQRFFVVLERFLTGAYGAQEVLLTKKNRGRKRQGEAWAYGHWRSYTAALRQAMAAFDRGSELSRPFRRDLGDGTRASAILAGVTLLHTFAGLAISAKPEGLSALIRLWRLDRRLASRLVAAGMGTWDEVWPPVQVTLDLFGVGAVKPATLAHKAASILACSPAAPATLGANTYDGVRWFNQERTAASLAFAALALSAFPPDPLCIPDATDLHRRFQAAAKQADYQVDTLLEKLRPKPTRGHGTRDISPRRNL
jgi:hypothetical protein